MLLALLAFAVLNASQAPLTLGALQGLPPEAMGNKVLAGQDHGVVVAIEGPNHAAMMAEGFMELVLTQRAGPRSGGCLRRRWTASFLYRRGNAERSAELFDRPWAATEVALPSPACTEGEFVRVNTTNISIDDAVAGLKSLDALRSGKARVEISCSDSTSSGLCGTPRAIPRQLAGLRPWMVTKVNGDTEVWLSVARGGTVTAVRFSESRPDLVTVRRYIPPPF